MNSTLDVIQLIPRSFIHYRAKRAAKYMNTTVITRIQIFPLLSQMSRGLFGEWLKVALALIYLAFIPAKVRSPLNKN